MKNLPLLLFSILSISCTEKKEPVGPQNDFADKVVNFCIENPDDQYVELPGLYDKTTTFVPDVKEENLILAEKLKFRGFKTTGFKQANFPLLGRRIVTMTLENPDCGCQVDKIYYITTNVSEYFLSERIKCTKK